MPEVENAAPAGAGEGDVSSIDTSLSAVADLIAGDEEQSPAPDASEAPGGSAEAEQVADGADAAAAAEPEQGKPEAQSEEEQEAVAHGNMVVRLRDGTTRRVADLKKLVDLQPELERQTAALNTRATEFQQHQARIAQQEQFFNQVVPAALNVLRNSIPPEPDPRLMQTDPMRHYEETHRRNQIIAQFNQLSQAAVVQKQQVDQQARARSAANLQAQQKALVERFPELATSPEKRAAFHSGVLATVSKYGFTEGELNQTVDARILHLVHDLGAKARAYDALMAQKPKPVAGKPAPAAAAAQVQTPGRRAAPSDARSAQKTALVQRVKAGGGQIRDVAALIAADED